MFGNSPFITHLFAKQITSTTIAFHRLSFGSTQNSPIGRNHIVAGIISLPLINFIKTLS